jgi:Tfp pilus assembly protein PilF
MEFNNVSTYHIPLSFVYCTIIFLFILFILVYLRFTSIYVSKRVFKAALFIILPAYFCVSLLSFLLKHPQAKKCRIAVIPLYTFDIDENNQWQLWTLSEQANRCLIEHFSADTLVYPLSWTWQTIDRDSVYDVNYLLKYSRRIALDYVALSSLKLTLPGDTCQFHLIDLRNRTNVSSASPPFFQNDISTSSIEMAGDILRFFKRTVGASYALPPSSPRLEQSIAETEKRLAERRFADAIKSAEAGFVLDSANVHIRNLLAKANLEYSVELEQKGKPGALYRLLAAKICEGTIQIPGAANSTTFAIVGKYFLLKKMWGKAESYLKKAIDLDPNNVEAYLTYANLHRSRMKDIGFNTEEQVMRHALFLNPCYVEGYLRLADLLYFSKLPERAEKVLDELLRINPSLVDALLFLGKMAVAENNAQNVIRIYNRILEIDPTNEIAHYNLGVYYFNLGQIETAEKFFNKAVQLGNHVDSHLYLGYIYESQGKNDLAIEEYRIRLRLKKGPDDTYADVARKHLYALTRPDSSVLKSHGQDR